jgi:hypothetical protein
LTITCTSTGFSAAAAPAAASPKSATEQIADLEALVRNISALKDPFKSDLIGDLEDATSALDDSKPAEAAARLDHFVSGVKAVPAAQLTSDQRSKLIETATQIRRSIGSGP